MINKSTLDLLDEVRAIAQQGINHTKDAYDLQRYHRLLQLAAQQYSEHTQLPSDEIRKRFERELGYVTPKIGVQGAIFNDAGEILLEKRLDDSLWGILGGWVEVGETPEDAFKREVLEEANLVVDGLELIDFYTRLPGPYHQPHTSIHVLYFCNEVSGALKKSFESLDMKYCDHRKIHSWHKDHQGQAEKAYQHWLVRREAKVAG